MDLRSLRLERAAAEGGEVDFSGMKLRPDHDEVVAKGE